MPIRYRLDGGLALIRTRCTGEVSFEEVLDHFRTLKGDASLPERLDVLLDLTEMRSVPESKQLDSVAREVGALLDKVEWGCCAIVASGDLLYGMSRVFQALAESHFARLTVVRSLEEAEQWLASFRPPAT